MMMRQRVLSRSVLASIVYLSWCNATCHASEAVGLGQMVSSWQLAWVCSRLLVEEHLHADSFWAACMDTVSVSQIAAYSW